MAYSHSDEEEEETNLAAWLFKEAQPENVTRHSPRHQYLTQVIGMCKAGKTKTTTPLWLRDYVWRPQPIRVEKSFLKGYFQTLQSNPWQETFAPDS